VFVPPGDFLFYHFIKMKAQTQQKENSQLGAENSTDQKLTIVKFHSTKIQCITDPDGSIHVALKPIMDAIGLHADSAWLGIKNDSILGAKHSVRRGLDAKNRQFPMQTLPIEYVHGWLFSIDASKVSAAAKPKLLQFKKECYQVLFDHFYGKYKVYEENLNRRRLLMSQLGVATANKSLYDVQIRDIKKQLAQIEEEEITGQLKLIK
jgi:hypothetical protein